MNAREGNAMIRRFAINALGIALASAVLLHAQTPGPGAPISGSVEVRLIEPVDSTRDAAGKQFRGTVTQRVNAGSVSIPQNAVANMTLTNSGGTFTVTLDSILLNGQPLVVTSGPPAVVSDNSVGKLLGRFGLPKTIPGVTPGATPSATGASVSLLPGTTLRFSFTATTALSAAVANPTGQPATQPNSPGARPGGPGAAGTAAPTTGPASGAGTAGTIPAAVIRPIQ